MRVNIMSQKDALRYSKTTEKSLAIISIVGEKEKPLVFSGEKVVDVFRMFFEDIERPCGLSKMPSREDFVGLKEFIDKNRSLVEEIVVHCHAGVSRSSACASAIIRYLGEDDSFIWSSFDYIPNRLVLSYAIEELGLNLTREDIEDMYRINDEAHMMCSEFIFTEEEKLF